MEQKKIDNQIFDAENEVKIVFQSNNNFIFALDANNLYAENYGLIKTLSYNEIYSVRLDFHKSEIREYNPRRVDYFIQYSCFINENLEIKSKILQRAIFFDSDTDVLYNNFILELHEKLSKNANGRIYTTNALKQYFRYIVLCLTAMWSAGFFLLTENANYEIKSYMPGIMIAFVATLKIIWETMPESYAPSKIPTRFLS